MIELGLDNVTFQIANWVSACMNQTLAVSGQKASIFMKPLVFLGLEGDKGMVGMPGIPSKSAVMQLYPCCKDPLFYFKC